MKKLKLSCAALLSVLLFTVGCSEGTITDPDTKPSVKLVGATDSEDIVVIHYKADTMDRGNHDFFDKEVVIDTKYYEQNEIKRGDIVAVEFPDSGNVTLLRVVGLPGEKVKIVKGQVYINGKQLDTFYGRYHHVGMDLEAYQKRLKERNLDAQTQNNIENQIHLIEDNNFKEVEVQKDHAFLLGDDWFRSSDSRVLGTLPEKSLVGKVLGVK